MEWDSLECQWRSRHFAPEGQRLWNISYQQKNVLLIFNSAMCSPTLGPKLECFRNKDLSKSQSKARPCQSVWIKAILALINKAANSVTQALLHTLQFAPRKIIFTHTTVALSILMVHSLAQHIILNLNSLMAILSIQGNCHMHRNYYTLLGSISRKWVGNFLTVWDELKKLSNLFKDWLRMGIDWETNQC